MAFKFDKFQYVLAPLEDFTDNAFRTLCHRHGADLTFTEMVRLEGLARDNKATWSRLDFHDDTPTVVQILGIKEERLKRFLSKFEPSKGFKGFNLNMGCPSPHVVKLGQGCAMIKRISKAKALVQIFKDRGFPISIKMRLGMNQYEKEKKAYLNLIDAVDADFFIVHSRHGAQLYSEAPDYSVYAECVAKGKPIIANGDIDTKEKLNLLKGMGVAGVMIGRPAVSNPAIFNQLKDIPAKPLDKLREEYLALAEGFNAPFRYRKNVAKYLGTKFVPPGLV